MTPLRHLGVWSLLVALGGTQTVPAAWAASGTASALRAMAPDETAATGQVQAALEELTSTAPDSASVIAAINRQLLGRRTRIQEWVERPNPIVLLTGSQHEDEIHSPFLEDQPRKALRIPTRLYQLGILPARMRKRV